MQDIYFWPSLYFPEKRNGNEILRVPGKTNKCDCFVKVGTGSLLPHCTAYVGECRFERNSKGGGVRTSVPFPSHRHTKIPQSLLVLHPPSPQTVLSSNSSAHVHKLNHLLNRSGKVMKLFNPLVQIIASFFIIEDKLTALDYQSGSTCWASNPGQSRSPLRLIR